jgi:hypothetical protein
MLFLGLGAVAFTATLVIGGIIAYQQFWGSERDTTESEVPVLSYYTDEEWFSEPQASIKYLVEDEDSVDLDDTLEAVMDWVYDDDPNIFTGDFTVRVSVWNDVGLVEINGDASTMIQDNYDNVELPYVDGANNFETVEVDLQFA